MAPPDQPRSAARRTADVGLRYLTPGAKARAHWPASRVDPPVAPLVVLFASDRYDLDSSWISDLATRSESSGRFQ